jgi:hypothetical protein
LHLFVNGDDRSGTMRTHPPLLDSQPVGRCLRGASAILSHIFHI